MNYLRTFQELQRRYVLSIIVAVCFDCAHILRCCIPRYLTALRYIDMQTFGGLMRPMIFPFDHCA
jgi:hypothetical protein